MGGGISSNKKIKFLHLGGQSGSIGGENIIDTTYSYTDLKKAGLSVGSGAIVVMDETVSITQYIKQVTEFFIHESCGKCVPCREGNRQLNKLLKIITIPGAADLTDLVTIKRICDTMNAAAFCGLGQTATAALISAWNIFRDEFEASIGKKKPAEKTR